MATKSRLLVVDDELIVRDSLDKWFREEGYDVAVADSAQEALAKMATGRFDLALVDIKMPGVDGVELQKRMHEIDPDMHAFLQLTPVDTWHFDVHQRQVETPGSHLRQCFLRAVGHRDIVSFFAEPFVERVPND